MELKVEHVVKHINFTAEMLGIESRDVSYQNFLQVQKEHGIPIDNELSRKIKQLGGFNNIRDAHFKPKVTEKSVELAKIAKANRVEAKNEAHTNILLQRYEQLSQRIFAKPFVIPQYQFKKNHNIERHQHILLSDLHFGSRLDPREGLMRYGAQEESRRLAQIVTQVIDYKPQYRKNTKLWVNLNGDVIQGNMHDFRDGEPTPEQACIAQHLLIQALSLFSRYYPQVEVNCASGNHDRDKYRHMERAIHQKWASWATIIYYGIKKAVVHIDNVKVNIPRSPWFTYRSFGANYYATHGDTTINVGYPGDSINIKNLEVQINKLNAPLHDSEKYKVVMIGHVHVGFVIKLNSGVTLITNPALLPADSFAKSILVSDAHFTGQMLFESVPGYPVGDTRFLEVNEKTHYDASLDKVIQPFIDF